MNYQAKITDLTPEDTKEVQPGDGPGSFFANSRAVAHPAIVSNDPAERLEFSRLPAAPMKRFDMRSDATLLENMFDHPESQERERAAWEYADRLQEEAVRQLVLVAQHDCDPSIRWGLLWLMQKIAGSRAFNVIEPFLKDADPEVRDWAQLLLREISGHKARPEDRPAQFDLANPFDQTLPLMIAGHAHTLVPGMGWIRATLSPKWFEAILGRVMACTRTETFDTDLVIEKELKSYHPDGSNHYEIFKFRGFTVRPAESVSHHIYECVSTHTFYPSGKVEHQIGDAVEDMGVMLGRVAQAELLPMGDPELPFRIVPVQTLPTCLGSLRRENQLPDRIVRSVRGRYMGTAYVNVDRLMGNGLRIGSGEVQLSSKHHPRAGHLTNTFLSGTFKGKLSDTNGDGDVDINTEPCHGTIAGDLDYRLLGHPNADPYDPFQKT